MQEGQAPCSPFCTALVPFLWTHPKTPPENSTPLKISFNTSWGENSLALLSITKVTAPVHCSPLNASKLDSTSTHSLHCHDIITPIWHIQWWFSPTKTGFIRVKAKFPKIPPKALYTRVLSTSLSFSPTHPPRVSCGFGIPLPWLIIHLPP